MDFIVTVPTGRSFTLDIRAYTYGEYAHGDNLILTLECYLAYCFFCLSSLGGYLTLEGGVQSSMLKVEDLPIADSTPATTLPTGCKGLVRNYLVQVGENIIARFDYRPEHI